MPAMDFSLGRLLAPVSQETFFRDYWERQPLRIERGKPGYYDGLFSLRDLDSVIAFTRPKFTDTAALQAKAPRMSSYVQGWLAERPVPEGAGFPGIEDLRRVYDQGKTVVIMTMQRRWPAIAEACRGLEAVFDCPVHANLYLTPQGAQGFDAHFDPHEVLVLHLEGTKTWRLYGSARPLPLVDERFNVPKDQLGTPREIRLEPGDLLYIPRGFVHEAFTADCASLHLTVGINVYRWMDLLQEALLLAAREDVRFRESVPRGALRDRKAAASLQDRFRELLAILARDARVEEAARLLGDQFFGQLPVLPDSYFAPSAPVEDIDLDTVLEKAPGAICRVLQDGDWVVIEYPGGQVGGPSKIAPALRFIARTDRFPARALPDTLGADGKLVLIRRLVRERLLRVVGRDASAPAAGALTSAVGGE